MKEILDIAWWILSRLILVPLFGLLAAAMLLGPGIASAWETYDMIVMSETATAAVRRVGVERSGKGSRPAVAYEFVVEGTRHESTRYLPGFLGDWGTWSGGGSAAATYVPGQEVEIHYRPGRPEACCLEFGWFKWSVGLTLIFWGAAAVGLASWLRMRTSGALPGRAPRAARMAMVFGGILLVFLSPSVVRPHELHWYALAGLGLFGAFLLHGIWTHKPPVDVD